MSGCPIRVLVVDDDQDGAEAMAMVFRLDGHQVSIATDGEAAVEEARARRPDLVLLDLGLAAGLDGLDVARRIRRLRGLEETRIVAVTGHGAAEHRLRALDAGFDRYLVKPVDPALLRGMVEDLPLARGERLAGAERAVRFR